jgi:type IV fimbrial biogenesis protein FimT
MLAPAMKAKHAGFTLIEMMVAVLLAAILLGIGAPSFVDFLRNARLTSASNGLLGAVHLARTEAIKRRAPVTVCASSDPTKATPSCDDKGDFSGWLVFVDDDGDPDVGSGKEGNGTFEPGTGDEVLIRTSGRPADGVTVIPSAVYLQFGENGFQSRPGGAAPADVNVRFCDKRGSAAIGDSGSAARLLEVSRTGRPQVSRDTTAIKALGGCPGDG